MTTGRKKPHGSTQGQWKVRLLGEPALVAPGGREHLLERRAAALLALAAVEPGIARRNVARMLWPDSSESNARQALRQQLLRIRKMTGCDVFEPGASLRLAAGVASDALERSAAEAFLGSFDYGTEDELAQWVARERERRHGSVVEDLSTALERAEADGDLASALAFAQRLVRAEDSNERHHRALMRLHYLSGDVAQAQADYQRLREMLVREYAATPSAETEQLARTLRSASGSMVAVRSAPPPPSLTRPPRLVGRERAWQALHEAWAEGHGAVVSGVAGMGKSRLLAELAASRSGIVSVTARPGDAYAPYSVLARVARAFVERVGGSIRNGVRAELASLLPELGDGRTAREGADRGRMLRAVETLTGLAVAHDIAGLVVDDAHYADAASLEALAAQVAPGGLRIIVAFRADEIGAEARALAEAILAPGTSSEVVLDPLDEPQVAQLIDSLEVPGLDGVRLARRVTRHTGGNPLFVLETLKALLLEGGNADGSMPVAANVRELIARRLSRLPERALALARCAAVAGQDFSAELASHVMGVRPLELADAWAELERVHVLRDGAFDHDLVHEAARASVPAAIARRLHAEIAAFLESASVEPARVAQHWVAAQRPREAGAALLAAAGRARAAGRRHEECELLEQAADCLAQVGDADGSFEALLARAGSMIYDDLGQAAQQAVRLATCAARTDDQRLRALLREAQYLSHRSDSQDAVRVGGRGRAMAQQMGREELEVHFAAIEAGGLCELRRVDEALARLAPYREGIARFAPRIAADFLVQLGIVLDLASRLREALEAFEAARRISAEHNLKDILATALSNLATTMSKRGQLDQAIEHGRQALRLWREAEALKGTPMQTQVLLAHRLRDAGHYEEAIAMLEEALAEFRRAGARAWVFAAAHRLALAYSFLGQHARAIKLLNEDASTLPTKSYAIWEAHRGEVARAAGGTPGEPMRHAIALLGEGVDDSNQRLVSLFAAGAVPAGDGEAMAAAVAAWAMAHERFGMAIAAHARAAGCALSQGAVARAVAQAEGALRLEADYQPDNFYRPEVWWIASQAFAAAQRNADADRLLARAHTWILDTASAHVPPRFRESFLHRNSVNRAVLEAARRRLPTH